MQNIPAAISVMMAIMAGLALCAGKQAQAGCYQHSQAPDLENYCALSLIAGKKVSRDAAILIERKLWDRGFDVNLSTEHIDKPKDRTRPFAFAGIDYVANMNGGNPKKDVQIGEHVFTGDEALVGLSGFMPSVTAGLSYLRQVHRGHIVTFSSDARFRRHLETGYENKLYNIRGCSSQHIADWSFIDVCLRYRAVLKKLSKSEDRTVSVAGAKVFSHPGDNSFAQARIGVVRLKTRDYVHRHIVAGYVMLFPEQRFHLSLEGRLGEKNQSKHVMRSGLTVRAGIRRFKLPLSFSYSLEHYRGSRLFGVDRKDRTQTVAVTARLTDRWSASLGFEKNTSRINYFDTSSPIIVLNYHSAF